MPKRKEEILSAFAPSWQKIWNLNSTSFSLNRLNYTIFSLSSNILQSRVCFYLPFFQLNKSSMKRTITFFLIALVIAYCMQEKQKEKSQINNMVTKYTKKH